VDYLATEPPWRESFYRSLASLPHSKDRFVVAIFERQKETPGAPTRSEVSPFLHSFAARNPASALALYNRLFTRSATSLLLRNGSFESTVSIEDYRASTPPFEWTFTPAPGVLPSVDDSPHGNGRALLLDHDGYSSEAVGRQVTVLAPGRYRLSYDVYPERVLAHNPVEFRLFCGHDNIIPPTRETELSMSKWNRRQVEFSVPGKCKIQQLVLAMVGGPRRAHTVVWVDNVRVEPLKASAPSRSPRPTSHQRPQAPQFGEGALGER
jgi:hypothetical protein